jgi:hypothetical protein
LKEESHIAVFLEKKREQCCQIELKEKRKEATLLLRFNEIEGEGRGCYDFNSR